MLLNCGVGEDSWESLGLQGEPISPSKRKSVLYIHWKDWYWSWNSNTLASWCEKQVIWKDTDAGKDWREEEKWTTDDKMVGWHHQLDGHEVEQDLGVGNGQESLTCCSPWSHEKLGRTDCLNDTELNIVLKIYSKTLCLLLTMLFVTLKNLLRA